jgi:hypothetical protein
MSEQQNTIVCSFDPKSPRMSAFDIHEWIYDTVRLTEADVAMVQVDGSKWQVFVKLREFNKTQEILTPTSGSGDVRHMCMNGEILTVRIEAAGLVTNKVRLANLHPEVLDSGIRIMMSRYGDVREVLAETWSMAYRNPVDNGIRIAVMTLRMHVPSNIVVAVACEMLRL